MKYQLNRAETELSQPLEGWCQGALFSLLTVCKRGCAHGNPVFCNNTIIASLSSAELAALSLNSLI